MQRAVQYAQKQFRGVKQYRDSLGVDIPIHIGETGWASADNNLYGFEGSKATDEYKEGLYYKMIRDWTNQDGISCFYFEAFDEPWKDGQNPGGSENHFGLFTKDGKAKKPVWALVDEGVFNGLKRGGNSITKTYDGKEDALFQDAMSPPDLSN